MSKTNVMCHGSGLCHVLYCRWSDLANTGVDVMDRDELTRAIQTTSRDHKGGSGFTAGPAVAYCFCAPSPPPLPTPLTPTTAGPICSLEHIVAVAPQHNTNHKKVNRISLGSVQTRPELFIHKPSPISDPLALSPCTANKPQ